MDRIRITIGTNLFVFGELTIVCLCLSLALMAEWQRDEVEIR